jgi:hypothetical protein
MRPMTQSSPTTICLLAPRRWFVAVVAVCITTACFAAAAPAASLEAFLERHCYACHSGTTPEAGLDLATLSRDLADPVVRARFVRIHDRVAAGEMPPPDEERPDKAEKKEVVQWLDRELTTADEARVAKQGRIRMRRMTRSEYENTLRDLLALPRLDVQDLLPKDAEVAGFDKVADALDLSPVHLAAYAAAAEEALTRAIATRSTPPPVYKKRLTPAGLFKFTFNLQNGDFVLLKNRQPDPAFPVRGGFEDVKGIITAPNQDADMAERKRIWDANKVAESTSAVGLLWPPGPGFEAAWNVAPVFAGHYRLRMSVWGFQWNAGKVETIAAQAAAIRAHPHGRQEEGGRLLGLFTAPSLESQVHEVTAWLDARDSIVFSPASLYWHGLKPNQIGGRAAKHVGPGVAVDWFEVEGPINESWPPESHKRLFGDLRIGRVPQGADVVPPVREPVQGIGGYLPNYYVDIPPAERTPPLETVLTSRPLDDARRLMAAFLPRAFRRPVASEETAPYVALVEERLAAKDCFEDAMRRAYVAALTSPEFLFHAPGAADDDAFASRLAYWLWNGPPDERLLAAARSGRLADTQVIHDEVERLLADPRSGRFLDGFTDQWLELDRIDETTPDRQLYPEFSWLLRDSMVAETRGFVRECLDKNLPAKTLVDADFTMLTQRLAEHYRIKGIEGVEVRRVATPADSHRGGLLTQAAIHKLTANGTTTSPVKRGVWVMDRLFNMPPPPPPPGISAIDPDTRGTTTVREQLDKHRSDQSCAVCHRKIDPPGFALECFDPVGGYRDRYRSGDKGDPALPAGERFPWYVWYLNYKLGPRVDASGTLPGNKTFAGIDDFRDLVATYDDAVATAFVSHLVRYATGADLSYADRAEVARIVAATAADGHGLRSLLHAVAASKRLMRR